jgi:hypothetical protein
MNTGISRDQWAETPEPEGFKIVPKGTGLDFEITEIREDHTDRGKRGPHDYVQVVCTYTDEEGEAFDHWEYFALLPEALGWFKKFLTGIGRCDLMVEDADWQELIGTEFACDVTHRKVNGEWRSNLNYESLVNKSHDNTTPPGLDDDDEPEDGGKKASPKRPARGRAGR